MKMVSVSTTALLLLLSVVPARAERPVAALRWAELSAAGKLEGGAVEGEALVIRGTAGRPALVSIATLDHPDTGLYYAIRGKVQASGVEGTAYLQTWNHFGARGSYFSRTLGEFGPMAAIRGEVQEREFVLPFDGNGGVPPERVEFSAQLQGAGELRLTGVELVRFEKQSELWGALGPGPSQGSAWVGLFGGLLGVFFGILGSVTGLALRRGRARTLVLSAWAVALVLGMAAALIGGVDTRFGTGVSVLGAGAAAVALVGLLVVRARFRAEELRRMRAMDSQA
ncbi:MAG: hypothetical protein U1E65_04280 [Myxococcota bacterium]